jgi:outer membrane protein TolC
VQLQQSIALTSRNVKNAYYDMMYAVGNLNVQRQSLELAQQSLKDNRARVEIGTMAPIDIVQAEAEVAQREESVILAEAPSRVRGSPDPAFNPRRRTSANPRTHRDGDFRRRR